MLLFLGLLMFVLLVVLHELGHYLAARRAGVVVEEFGIGFPPRAFYRKLKNGLILSFNWLPLGGFVKLKGEYDASRSKGSFGAASMKAKAKIILAGVGANVLIAYILLMILALIGLPKANLESLPFYDKPQFSVQSDTRVSSSSVHLFVIPDTPAAEAGLKDNDKLVSINGRQLATSSELPSLTEEFAGQKVPIVVDRDSQIIELQATLNEKRSEGQGYLGVVPVDYSLVRSTWSAPIVAGGLVWQYTEVSLKGLGYAIGGLFRGDTAPAKDTVGGPVATVKVLEESAQGGFSQILFVIALISLSLAIMNTLPIPALDGGRLFVMLLFRLTKKPLTKQREELIHGTGFVLLMGLFVLITIIDVKRFY
jgi:regulator of sigma E protease